MEKVYDKCKNTGYLNWLKAGLALSFLKEGLVDVVTNISKEYHLSLIEDIQKSFRTTQGALTPCLQCHSVCTPPFCDVKYNNCDGFKITTVNKGAGKCRQTIKICKRFCKKISSTHTVGPPTWRNSNVQQWVENHWEVSKCFMPYLGQAASNNGANDCDCAGIISLFINHKRFQEEVNETFGPNVSNAFTKVRDDRNGVMHAPDLSLKDDDLKNCTQHMTSLLKTFKNFSLLIDLQNAEKNIETVMSGSLVIADADELVLRIENQEAKLQEQQEQYENMESEIESLKKDAVTTQEMETKIGKLRENLTKFGDDMKAIHSLVERNKHNIDESVATRLSNLESTFENTVSTQGELEKRTVRLEKKVESVSENVTELQKRVLQHDKIIQESRKRPLESGTVYLQKRQRMSIYSQTREEAGEGSRPKIEPEFKKLKETLIEICKNEYSDIQVSPIYEDDCAKLDDVFTEIEMEEDCRRFTSAGHFRGGGDGRAKAVETYKDIFHIPTDGMRVRQIYITGKAGMGKSTCCLKLVRLWCDAHDKHAEDRSSDEGALAEFDFVFLLHLRSVPDESSIQTAICEEVLPQYPNLCGILADLLEDCSEKVLLLLDGLDECGPGLTETVRRRKGFYNCTAIITTRPWKLEEMQLKPKEIDRLIELNGLDDFGIKSLVRKLIGIRERQADIIENKETDYCLFCDSDNYDFGTEHACNCCMFLNSLKLKQASDIARNPLTLLILVTAWFEKKTLPSSLTETIADMIECILERTKRKSDQSRGTLTNTLTEYIPKVVTERQYFKMKLNDLLPLADLAYRGLMTKEKQNALVFEKESVFGLLGGKAERVLEWYFRTGLITESKAHSLRRRRVSVSFIHKLVQEFFGALRLACDSGETTTTEFIRFCSSSAVVSDMHNVIRFLSGLRPELGMRLSKHMVQVCSEDNSIIQYRSSTGFNPVVYRKVEELTELVIDCQNESMNAQEDTSTLRFQISDFICVRRRSSTEESIQSSRVIFTSQMETVISAVLDNNFSQLQSICVRASLFTHSVKQLPKFEQLRRLELNLDEPELSKNIQRIFKQMCSAAPLLKILRVRGCTKQTRRPDCEIFLDSPEQLILYRLILRDFQLLKPNSVKRLEITKSQMVQTSPKVDLMSALNTLRLAYMDINDSILSDLFQQVSLCPSLKTLYLYRLFVQSQDAGDRIILDLTNLQLEELTMADISAVHSVHFNPCSLKTFQVAALPLCDVEQMISMLSKAKQLQVLTLGDVLSFGWGMGTFLPSETIATLVNTLPGLQHLQKLHLFLRNYETKELQLDLPNKLNELGMRGDFLEGEELMKSFVDTCDNLKLFISRGEVAELQHKVGDLPSNVNVEEIIF